MEQNIPKSIREYWLYYLKYDPLIWILFFLQDIVHFSRYQLAFIFIGQSIDILIQSSPGDGVPERVWFYAGCVFLVLAIGEGAHIWTAYIIRKWKPGVRRKIRADFFEYTLSHSHKYFQDHFAGSLARKISEIAESSMRLHDHLRFNIAGSLIVMTSAMIAMLYVSPIYSGLLLAFIISVTAPVLLRLKRIGNRARLFSDVRAQVTGGIVQ
jgi:ABC-type multidrug transport system fused ATPase/permease subunit